MAHFPDIEIDVGVSDKMVDMVDMVDMVGDDVDYVIRGGATAGPFLVVRAIGETAWVTCAIPEYVKKHGLPSHPDELRERHRVVSYLSTQTSRVVPLRFSDGQLEIELAATTAVRINESNGHVATGLAGLGIVQTLFYMGKTHLEEGSLVPVFPGWQPPDYPFYVLFPPNRYISSRQRVFIDWLIERFPALLTQLSGAVEVQLGLDDNSTVPNLPGRVASATAADTWLKSCVAMTGNRSGRSASSASTSRTSAARCSGD